MKIRTLLLLFPLLLPLHAHAADTCQYTAASPNNSKYGENTPVNISCSGIGLRVDTSLSPAGPLPAGAATSALQSSTQAAPGAQSSAATGVQGVTGGVPVPVSATSLPLPTGAATAANQTNVQSTAGVSDSTVLNVQGNAGGVPLPVSSAAPTDTYPAGGNITAQDAASVTVQGQFNQNQTTGTPTASSSASFLIAGYTTFSLGITGTWTGTLTVEAATAPTGVTTSTVWTNKTCRVPGTTLVTSVLTANASDLICNVAGYTNVRVRATAAMTGTAVIGALAASINTHAIDLINPVKLVDGSGTSNTLTIKAASTAPLSTDTAAVVTISPNSPAQSANLAQVNGVTTSTGAGVTGTGSQRVGVAQDATTLAGSAPGVAGTPSTNVVTTQGCTGCVAEPSSVYGINGSSAATLTNPLSVSEPDGGAVVAPVAANGTGTATSAAVLFTLDTSGYNGISVQVTSAGTTCTITYEGSNDNVTWLTVLGARVDTISTIPINLSTAAVALNFVMGLRYFRARVSTYTSGTVTAFYSLRRDVVGNSSPTIAIANASGVIASSNPLAIVAIAGTGGGYSFTNITTNATTTAKSGAGTLHAITVNNPGTTETLTIYDNTAGSGTKIGTVAVGTNLTTLIFDLAFSTGLTIVSAGTTTGDWTATWK